MDREPYTSACRKSVVKYLYRIIRAYLSTQITPSRTRGQPQPA